MFNFLAADANTPFVVALGVMLVLAAIELIGALTGLGLSSLIDSLIPDFDIDVDVDLDADLDAEVDISAPGGGFFEQILGWLYLGKVPALVLLITFLTTFGLSGLMMQALTNSGLGVYLPSILVSIPAFIIALFCTRMTGAALAHVIPKEESDATSRADYIGRVATIIRGQASRGNPAEAKLKDQHDTTHYVLVEPDHDDETLAQGEEVLIVKGDGSRFYAIKNTHDSLSSKS